MQRMQSGYFTQEQKKNPAAFFALLGEASSPWLGRSELTFIEHTAIWSLKPPCLGCYQPDEKNHRSPKLVRQEKFYLIGSC